MLLTSYDQSSTRVTFSLRLIATVYYRMLSRPLLLLVVVVLLFTYADYVNFFGYFGHYTDTILTDQPWILQDGLERSIVVMTTRKHSE
jgi:hypothetical protein